MSDVLTIDNQGVLMVRRIQEKFYVGKKLLDIRVLRPDEDWVFNMIYRDGKEGVTYAKRFHIGGFTRDKEYPLTQGTKGSRVFFFSVHKTEEESAAIAVNVYFKNALRPLRSSKQYFFRDLRVKGRNVMGNMVTKKAVERIARIMPAAAPAPEDATPQEPTGDAAMPAAPAEATETAPLGEATTSAASTPASPAPEMPPVPPMEDTQGTFDFL